VTLRQKFASVFRTAAMVAPVGAQTDPRTIMRMTFVRIKPDQYGEWASCLRDRAAVLSKTGARHDYTIWTAASGEEQVLRVDLFSKWADLDVEPYSDLKDQAVELARIEQRLDQCTQGVKRVFAKIDPEASLPLTAHPTPMILLSTLRLKPGTGLDLIAAIKSDLLPAAKKAGIKLFFVAQNLAGAEMPEYTTVGGQDNWAFNDNDPLGSMPEYQRYAAKRAAVLVTREGNYYRFRPDLSYLPAQPASTLR
jgi:hypothetical protein